MVQGGNYRNAKSAMRGEKAAIEVNWMGMAVYNTRLNLAHRTVLKEKKNEA